MGEDRFIRVLKTLEITVDQATNIRREVLTRVAMVVSVLDIIIINGCRDERACMPG